MSAHTRIQTHTLRQDHIPMTSQSGTVDRIKRQIDKGQVHCPISIKGVWSCFGQHRMRLLILSTFLVVTKALPHPPDSSGLGSDEEFLASLLGGVESSEQTVQNEAAAHAQKCQAHDEQLSTNARNVNKAENTEQASGKEAVSRLTDEQLLASLGLGANQGGLSRCEGDEYVCVPYYLCREDSIITDGAGLIDIRFGTTKNRSHDESFSHSECSNYIDVCCAAPIEKENITKPKYEPKCGRRNQLGINARIVGFKDGQSQFGEFPWMAAVLRKQEIDGEEKNLYVCGGALIHPQVILTAAHCVSNLDSNVLRVRLGEWDTNSKNEFYAHVDVDVTQSVIHPKYNSRNLHNDVALLFFSSPVELQPHIDTLCLPDPNENYDWSLCTATGWGKDRFDNGSYQTVLKQVDLMRENSSSCQESLRTTRLGQYFRLHSSFTCAGAPQLIIQNEYGAESVVTKPADTCTGDGGSPLACPSPSDPSRYVHGGIVAWGIGCGQEGVPGVYADPKKFLNWIDFQVSEYLQLEEAYWGYSEEITGANRRGGHQSQTSDEQSHI